LCRGEMFSGSEASGAILFGRPYLYIILAFMGRNRLSYGFLLRLLRVISGLRNVLPSTS